MSVVVGIEVAGQGVWLAAERMGTDNFNIQHELGAPKVWRQGPYIIGFVGSIPDGQAIQYRATLPPPPDWDVDRHMATEFIDTLRDVVGEHPAARGATPEGPTLLVGIGDRLYGVYRDYQCLHVTSGMLAIGSGYEVALGALHADTMTPDLTPQHRVHRAVLATSMVHAQCGGPIDVVTTSGDVT